MNWFEEAKKKKAELEAIGEEYSYIQIAQDYGVHYDTVRKKFKAEQPKAGKPFDVMEEVNKLLTKGTTIPTIETHLGLSQKTIHGILEELRDSGIQIMEAGERIKIVKSIIPASNILMQDWKGNKVIKYGVVSDTHFGSKHQQLTFLNSLYDRFEWEGIGDVIHAGDMTEGYHMRPGHEFEVFLHGADQFVDYVVDKYPYKPGIKTYFINGNHDYSFMKNNGQDIGKPISKSRADLHYLGMLNARIYPTPNCPIEINHGLDGSAYALSYSLQKSVDAMGEGNLPAVFINGHHHKTIYVMYRGIHGIEAGTTQAQTDWMKGKRLPAHVAGWIITLHVDNDGFITEFEGKILPCKTMLEKDW